MFSRQSGTFVSVTYGERLNHAIGLARTDRAALARALDISVSAISQVILGKTKALTADNSAKAARFLRVSHYWLATGEGDARASVDLDPEAIALAQQYQALDAAGRATFDAALTLAGIRRDGPAQDRKRGNGI